MCRKEIRMGEKKTTKEKEEKEMLPLLLRTREKVKNPQEETLEEGRAQEEREAGNVQRNQEMTLPQED